MIKFNENRIMGKSEDSSSDLGMEIHALSSAIKPLCSWLARNAIQDCRESCGGHGYLKSKQQHIIYYLNHYIYFIICILT
jgi:acyl-CoA oxidase